MDVQMPKMDGFEATREIRKRELHTGRHMPIIGLTAHVLDSFREECAEAGMDAFLPKPIEFEQLLDVLDQVLNVDRKPEVLASIRSSYSDPRNSGIGANSLSLDARPSSFQKVAARIFASSHSEQWSTYQTSSSKRLFQSTALRP
jgi:DNA-binding response OmpR family regulator